jgi:hypothetical protein
MSKIGAGIQTVANPSTILSLPSGIPYVLPSAQWLVVPGKYTFLQNWDPTTYTWRAQGTPIGSDPNTVSADGFNSRLINLTGTVVGAVITNAGSGYTNGIYYPSGVIGPAGQTGIAGNPNAVLQAGTAAAPSVTVAAGGGTNLAQGIVIVGGAINTTVTITAGGTGYTYPPTLVISNPPAGGWPATATCTISAGAINAVTVTNQGAGYSAAPTVTVVRHPLDNTGSGGVLTVNATLVGSGTVTGISFPINGAGHTSVPAISFSPASTTAATAIMCWTVTTANAQTNASHMAVGNVGIIGSSVTAGSATLTNPDYTTNLFTPTLGYTAYSTAAGGGTTVVYGGLHQVVPTGIVYAVLSDGTISAATTAVAPTMGGVADTSLIIQSDI